MMANIIEKWHRSGTCTCLHRTPCGDQHASDHAVIAALGPAMDCIAECAQRHPLHRASASPGCLFSFAQLTQKAGKGWKDGMGYVVHCGKM